jgi:hypothetical protein
MMIRAFCLAVLTIVLCAAAQTTKPANLEQENKMLREQLRQMETANRSLEQKLQQTQAQILRLQLRVTGTPAVPLNQVLPFRGAPEAVPPSWIPQKFNGMTFYIVPLSESAMTPKGVAPQYAPVTEADLVPAKEVDVRGR